MTKHERINRDLQRLRDSARLVLDDPEVWRLVIDTLPNGRYEVSIDYGDDLGPDPDVVIAAWSFVVFEVTSFYTTLEEIERL
jgi:hypothetical protein